MQEVCRDGRGRNSQPTLSSKNLSFGLLAVRCFTCSAACVIPPHADVLAETLAQRGGHGTSIPVLEGGGGNKTQAGRLGSEPASSSPSI